MRLLYIFVIALFSISNTIGQTQISHFVSDNSDTKNIVKNIDGKNYLLAFYQDDELSIFEIVSQDSMTFLHSRDFQGIYENHYVKIFGRHLVFESFSGLIIYDFVDDTYVEKTFDFPVSYIYYRAPSDNDFLASVNAKDTSLYYTFIIDFEGNITDTIVSGSIFERSGDNLVIVEYDYEQDKYTYAYQNFKTDAVDTLFSVYKSGNVFCLGTDKMWYQDDENNLVEYDYNSGNKSFFQNVAPYQSFYHYVFKSEDKLYLYNFDQSNIITHIQIFDINSKTKISEVDLDDIERIYRRQFYFYNDKIVLVTESGLVVINPQTKKYTLFDMYDTPDKLNIAEGGKVFIFNTLRNYGYVFNYIDIESQTMDTIYGNYRIVSRRHDFVKVGNNFIGSFYENPGSKSIFVLNLDSMNYYPATNFDNTNTGFEEGSRIVEINDKIMVLADNLYELVNDTLNLINTMDIFSTYNKYSVQNNKVYFQHEEGEFPNSYINLYSYDTRELKKEMRIKVSWDLINVTNFLDAGNFVYFVSLHDLYRYDKVDSSVVLIDDNLKNLFTGERSFLQKDGIVYYVNEGLKMIIGAEEPVILKNSLFGYQDYLLKFKDRLFWIANDGFYEIKGEDVITIHLNNSEYMARIVVDKAQKNLLYTVYNDGTYHYDGTSFDKIPTSDKTFGASPAIGESFILKEEKDSKYYYYFYDCTSGEITELPSEQIDDRYFDAFVSNGDSILMTKYWVNPKDILHIYKATDKFRNLELINEIQDVGSGIKSRFKSFGNEGLLYTGDIIYLMDENLEFHPLQGIKGDNYHPEIIEKNGDLYFLAINKTTGRQLYKTTLYSYIKNNTRDFGLEYLQIFPNPAKDIIYLKNFEIGNRNSYKISNLEGKILAQKQLTTPRINISNLNQGIYILSIDTDGSVISGKFIKY